MSDDTPSPREQGKEQLEQLRERRRRREQQGRDRDYERRRLRWDREARADLAADIAWWRGLQGPDLRSVPTLDEAAE